MPSRRTSARRREGVSTEEALKLAVEAERSAEVVLDDETTGRLLMFLLNLLDELKNIEAEAQSCLEQVKLTRNNNPAAYDADRRIRIQEALAEMEAPHA